MLPILGIVVVFAAVIGGFFMEDGKLVPLLQPSELLIICGAAMGTMVTANPWPFLQRLTRRILLVFRGPPLDRDFYLATLIMLHSVFTFARRNGMAKLEDAMEDPRHSGIMTRHAAVLRDPAIATFVCDTLLMTSLGSIPPRDIDRMLENDIEVRRNGIESQVRSLVTLADSLPGFGIVAAVLGVIITMGGLRESPQAIGLKVATALAGTFLGILLSYGVVGPLASNLESIGQEEAQYYETLRIALTAFAWGMPPSIAVECARRNIPPENRPDFAQMEKACKSGQLTRVQAA